jgi:hypothetical protein
MQPKIIPFIIILACLITSIFTGCIINESSSTTTTIPSKNQNPIPKITIPEALDTAPTYFDNNSIDAFVYSDQPITCDASESYDPDGMITSYTWILDENNLQKEGTQIQHTYQYDNTLQQFPNIIQIILTIEDNNGSIAFQSYNLGILPKQYIFYLSPNTLQSQQPSPNSESIKATFNLIRPSPQITYKLGEPITLPPCAWNATLHLKKPILSLFSKISITLYNTSHSALTQQTTAFRLIDFGREKTITVSGALQQTHEFYSMELTIIGFCFGSRFQIFYGGDTPSIINFDFTS